jgi:hypothetical protein
VSFDTEKARAEADYFLEYPDELEVRERKFAMMMRAACNEIDKLRGVLLKIGDDEGGKLERHEMWALARSVVVKGKT